MTTEYFPKFKQALKNSEAGISLQNTYRWESHFKTDETQETWKDVFGATGQVFTHSILFYNLMEWMVKKEGDRFTVDQKETLFYGTGPHDIGESKINKKGIGDVSAQDKTLKDEQKEVKMAYVAIDSLKLPAKTKSKLIDGYKKVVEGEDSELNNVFKALEKTEYVLTAMKVYQNCRRLEKQGKQILKLEKALVGRVLVKDLSKVLDVYAPRYPNSIGHIFHYSEKLIDEMFAFSLPWLNANDTWKGKPEDHAGMAFEFKGKWDAFKAQK